MAPPAASLLRSARFGSLLLGCLLAPQRAQAQQSLDQAFADGFSLLRFEPAPAGDRFFVVPEGAVPEGKPGVRAHVVGHYTLRPSLVRIDNATRQDRELVSKQLFLHPGLSYAPTSWLFAHVDVPVAASQSGQGPNAPESPALADPRVGVRVGLIGDEHAPFAFATGVDVWVPLGSQSNLVGDGAVRVLPRLNISGEALPFAYSATLGYQFRKHVNTGSLEVGDSLVAGAAAGLVLFGETLTVGPEFHAAWLVESDNDAFASRTSPMEVLFGARVRWGDAVIGAGIGPSLSDAPGVAPRVAFSLAYAPRTSAIQDPGPPPPSDQDNDGDWDSDDACPDRAGPSRPDPAQSGCPEPERVAQASLSEASADQASEEEASEAAASEAPPPVVPPPSEPDADGDGVPDARDACPKEPGLHSSDPKTSGCAVKLDAGQVKQRAEITFLGYRALANGRGVLFVELSDPVAVEASRAGQVVQYRLLGASVPLKNNKNPLLLRDFSSSALTATLVPDKKSVRLVITLRESVAPEHRLVARAAGKGAVLEIELPAPTPTPK